MRRFVVSLVVLPLMNRLSAQTITPAFAWPAGATAQVVTLVRTNASGGSAPGDVLLNDSSATRRTATMAVRAHADGLEITTSAAVVDRMVKSTLGAGVDVASLDAGEQRLVVTRDGRFVRLANVADIKRRADSILAPALEQARAMAPAAVTALQRSTSEEILTMAAEFSWRNDFTSMLGRTWQPGDSLATTASVPSPVAPGTMMQLPKVVRFDRALPCPAPATGSCWQFTTRSTMTRESLRAGFVEMAKQMGMDASMVDMIPIPESTTTTVSLFDASTLRPIRSEKTVVGGGSSSMMSMLTGGTTITTYTWK
jgi:hypothetical protein